MKMIEAVIKPVKLEEVTSALEKMGIVDFMESTIFCHGPQKGQSRFYRGAEYVAGFVEKVKLEIIASDDSVGGIIEAIGRITKTERREDCRIFVLSFLEAS
jgi:nitrogen regulatory protein P-II 1